MSNAKTAGIIFFIIFIIIIIIVIAIFFFATGDTNRPVRSSCTTTSQCANGLVCSDNTCLSPVGGSCTSLSDCTSSATACFNGVCTDKPLSGVGGTPPCQIGLIDENSVCVSMAGGTCNSNSDCASGLVCNDDGICIENQRGTNMLCSDSEPCASGFVCIDGECKIACNSCRMCVDSAECEGGSECINHRCTFRNGSCSSSSSSSSSSSPSSSSSSSPSRHHKKSGKSSSSPSFSSSSFSFSSSPHHKKSSSSSNSKSSSTSVTPDTMELDIPSSSLESTYNTLSYDTDGSSYETIDTNEVKPKLRLRSEKNMFDTSSSRSSLKSSILQRIRSAKNHNSSVRV